MTDTILSTLGILAATFGSILAWLSGFVRTLRFGTVFEFKLGEVRFALVIAWILFRLLQMFFDLFLDICRIQPILLIDSKQALRTYQYAPWRSYYMTTFRLKLKLKLKQ